MLLDSELRYLFHKEPIAAALPSASPACVRVRVRVRVCKSYLRSTYVCVYIYTDVFVRVACFCSAHDQYVVKFGQVVVEWPREPHHKAFI